MIIIKKGKQSGLFYFIIEQMLFLYIYLFSLISYHFFMKFFLIKNNNEDFYTWFLLFLYVK